MLSDWNKFVSKVYHEGKKKNPNYKFKDALKDASSRKSEMGHSSAGPAPTRRTRKSSKKSCMKKCKKMCKTQKMHGGRRRRRRGGSITALMPAEVLPNYGSPVGP